MSNNGAFYCPNCRESSDAAELRLSRNGLETHRCLRCHAKVTRTQPGETPAVGPELPSRLQKGAA